MNTFLVQYKNIGVAAQLLPQPLEGVIGIINETVKGFFKQYNYGKSDTKDFMIYCRPSVERFVFSKLYDCIHSMYKIKNMALDKEYLAKKQAIKSYSFDQLLKLFIIPKNSIPPETTCTRFVCILTGIEKSNSPREKIRDIMRMDSEVKAAMTDLTRTNKLKSKEEQSKLYMCLLAICELSAPTAEFNFLRDYLALQEKQYSNQQSILTSLQVYLSQLTIGKSHTLCECLQFCVRPLIYSHLECIKSQ